MINFHCITQIPDPTLWTVGAQHSYIHITLTKRPNMFNSSNTIKGFSGFTYKASLWMDAVGRVGGVVGGLYTCDHHIHVYMAAWQPMQRIAMSTSLPVALHKITTATTAAIKGKWKRLSCSKSFLLSHFQ